MKTIQNLLFLIKFLLLSDSLDKELQCTPVLIHSTGIHCHWTKQLLLKKCLIALENKFNGNHKIIQVGRDILVSYCPFLLLHTSSSFFFILCILFYFIFFCTGAGWVVVGGWHLKNLTQYFWYGLAGVR